jgi:hypothetical protein
MAGSLDYFVEKFLMVKWVWDRVALKPSHAPCWVGWLILAVWPLMVVVGIGTQWAVTGRGIHHQEREWLLASTQHVLTDLILGSQNCWVSGLSPSSGVLNTRRHNVTETGSASVLR